MNLEEQVRKHKELSLKIEELEEQKKALGKLIMEAMPDKYFHMEDYMVRKLSRFSITTSVEAARSLNATKMEEVVDKDKIKVLFKEGKEIPNVKEYQYIQILVKKPA
jgi:hypothetical protein